MLRRKNFCILYDPNEGTNVAQDFEGQRLAEQVSTNALAIIGVSRSS